MTDRAGVRARPVRSEVPMLAAPPPCVVQTVKNRCRVCFSCVRKCPAKAIRINKRQAEVIPERCLGCGSCVRVCSQGAKQVVSSVDEVRGIIASGARVAAMLAPSFPVEFADVTDFRVVVGMVRALGFERVVEVAFGADLVADRYRRLVAANDARRKYIGTACPAVVGYVERYLPDLIPNLAPIVSPMVAMARAMRHLEGADLKLVFVGPCVAKKVEGGLPELAGEVDAVLTFRELCEMLATSGVTADKVVPRDFDPPHPGLGALFPLSRGSLQAAGIAEDLVRGEVVAAEGLTDFTCALGEFAQGNLESELLELLSCNGCIAGPGLTTRDTLFRRRALLSHYVRYRMTGLDRDQWHRDTDRLAGLDLGRTFTNRDQRIPDCSEEQVREILARMGKKGPEDELNCGACGYWTCREHAIAIHKGLAEHEMCLPFVIDEFQKSNQELTRSHEQLKETQAQLMHSERLASMGQLAAGVAHELNNPLGVVLMYAHLLLDETPPDSPLREDLRMIADQADRCKRIVADLLDFARENKSLFQTVKVKVLIERCIASVQVPDNVTVQVGYHHVSPTWELDPDQMVQVMTNLIQNAIVAMSNGGGVLTIETREEGDRLVIEVADTGCGIAKENLSRVFQPFFTTRRNGKGTGLGLAVTYGIIKMHRGQIDVKSNADPAAGPTGTTFTIRIPRPQRSSGNGHAH